MDVCTVTSYPWFYFKSKVEMYPFQILTDCTVYMCTCMNIELMSASLLGRVCETAVCYRCVLQVCVTGAI